MRIRIRRRADATWGSRWVSATPWRTIFSILGCEGRATGVTAAEHCGHPNVIFLDDRSIPKKSDRVSAAATLDPVSAGPALVRLVKFGHAVGADVQPRETDPSAAPRAPTVSSGTDPHRKRHARSRSTDPAWWRDCARVTIPLAKVHAFLRPAMQSSDSRIHEHEIAEWS